MEMADNTGDTKKAADAVVRRLGEYLRTMPLSQTVRNEKTLDQAIRSGIRRYVAKHLPGAKVFTHGDTPEEKDQWSASKRCQNVNVFGFPNTGDIFVTDPSLCRPGYKDPGVLIELEFGKARGQRQASTLGSALQHGLGQAYIASIRHPYVILFVVSERAIPACRDGETQEDKRDRRDALTTTLWEDRRILVIVRGAKGKGLA
jgi:hypothetical protein